MSKIITASKLNRLWKNGVLPIKTKVDDLEENGSNTVANKLSSYDDIMTNTVEGYIPDALAIKEGFTQVNESLGKIHVSFNAIMNLIKGNGYADIQIPGISVGDFVIVQRSGGGTSKLSISPASSVALDGYIRVRLSAEATETADAYVNVFWVDLT